MISEAMRRLDKLLEEIKHSDTTSPEQEAGGTADDGNDTRESAGE